KAHYSLGLALQQSNDTEGAISELREAIRLAPDDQSAHYNLARVLGKVDPTAAAVEFQKFQSLKEAAEANTVVAHVNRGDNLLASGNLDGATKEFEEALTMDPDSATARYNLALVKQSHGNLDGAKEQLSLALQSNPGYVEAHNNLGAILFQQGQMQAAQ